MAMMNEMEWFTKQGVEVWSVNEGQQRFDSHVDKLMNYIRYWQASGAVRWTVRLWCNNTGRSCRKHRVHEV